MEGEIVEGRKMFALQELTDVMTERLQQHGIQKTVNGTRLKETVLQRFPTITAEKDARNRVFIVCSKTTKRSISDATQTPDEKARTLVMGSSILRKAVFDHDSAFSFEGSLPIKCEESSCPQRMKYFFRQLLTGPKSSPEQENSRKIISMCQIVMQYMTSTSANFQCEPLFAVFLALKLYSQTRSKRW